MKQKVLILSRFDDEHVSRLIDELEILGQSWVRFDPGDFPSTVELIAQLGENRDTTHLTLSDGKQIELEDVGSIWYRRPTPIQADSHLPSIQQIFIEREAPTGLWGLLRAIDGRWVNHPDAIREAAYKPQQLLMAHRLGLPVPKTLITNSPDDFQRFYEECHEKVIYKLLGFPRLARRTHRLAIVSNSGTLSSHALIQQER